MKRFLLSAVALMLSVYTSATLAAPESPFYVGLYLGDSTLDIQSKAHLSEEPVAPRTSDFEVQDSQTFSFMVSGGYRFTDLLGLELQYVTSLVDDKVYGNVKIDSLAGSEMNSSISALGVYAVLQGGEDAYVKARFGVGQSQASFETDFASTSFSSPDLSFGISIGQKFGNLGAVELTFMRYPDIKVSRQKFAQDFSSTAPFESYTTVRRDLGLEVLMVGYVFQF